MSTEYAYDIVCYGIEIEEIVTMSFTSALTKASPKMRWGRDIELDKFFCVNKKEVYT